MRFLLVLSDKISTQDIAWGLVELKEEVDNYEKDITIQSYIREEQEELLQFLLNNRYDAVITHNFSPTVSNACEESKTKYIAWIFDSPQIDLYTKEFHNSCNYLFVFDKRMCERLLVRKPRHLYHMPLAANVTRNLLLQITKEEEKRYSSEIAFVGSLYEENAWNAHIQKLPKEIAEKMERWLETHAFIWRKGETIFGCLAPEEKEKCLEHIWLGNWIEVEPEYLLETQFLVRKMAEIERVCIFNMLAEQYPVDLYTKSDTGSLTGVRCHPPVENGTTTSKIYYLSKINLNLTLRSIETGVPQRVFDIMGAGGFVLSNYQEELEELFVPGEEIVFFHDADEMMEQIDYYLHHEEERRRIALNGYRKVKECYSYPVALRKILDIVERDT